MSGKVPFLGIGAQKAGTTWLHQALSLHHDIGLSPIKELHYFNEIYRPEGHYRVRLKQLIRHARMLHEELDAAQTYRPYEMSSAARDAFIRQCRFFSITNDEEYLRYLLESAGSSKVFGEITPEYALLPAECFARIVTLMPGVRVLYIIRDPVERLWSELRMQARRKKADPQVLAREVVRIPPRSRYDVTIESVRRGGIGNFRIVLYETLFSQDAIGDILEFLALPRSVPPRVGRMIGDVVHEGEKQDIPEDFAGRARELLDPVYTFCNTLGLETGRCWKHA